MGAYSSAKTYSDDTLLSNTVLHPNAGPSSFTERGALSDTGMPANKGVAVKRGEIWYANLGMLKGSSVQGGIRPVLIISNDSNNRYSPTITIIPLTTRSKKRNLPTHVWMQAGKGNPLDRPSTALAEQITTIDKAVLLSCVGAVSEPCIMRRVEEAVREQLGI